MRLEDREHLFKQIGAFLVVVLDLSDKQLMCLFELGAQMFGLVDALRGQGSLLVNRQRLRFVAGCLVDLLQGHPEFGTILEKIFYIVLSEIKLVKD